MFINQPITALFVLPRLPGSGCDQHFDGASGIYSEQTEAKKAAELAHTRIARAFATSWTNREPYLVTGTRGTWCGAPPKGMEI